jgi:transcriptional regulator with XRE-family HTH domain
MNHPAMNFKRERLNRGLSQAKFAKAIGIRPSVYGRLELGKSISPANALKVAQFFEMEVTELFPLEDPEAAAA